MLCYYIFNNTNQNRKTATLINITEPTIPSTIMYLSLEVNLSTREIGLLYKPKDRYLMKISYTSLKRDLNFIKDIIYKAKCKL
jgi:hypothetical protein